MGALAYIFHVTMAAATAYAGKVSLADIQFSLLSDEHFATIISVLFGVGGLTYGVKERRLRKKTVSRLSEKARFYEERHDPDRGSSRLTPLGDTRRGDE